MEFDCLLSDGACLPYSHFKGCGFIILFTRKQCQPCRIFERKLQAIDLSKFINVVLCIVSMDNNVSDWDDCYKIPNWLQMPFYPIEDRKKLFKKFKVDSLPFLVIADETSWIHMPTHIVKSSVDDIKEFIDFTINCMDIEEFEII